jgi:hypothetical protein
VGGAGLDWIVDRRQKHSVWATEETEFNNEAKNLGVGGEEVDWIVDTRQEHSGRCAWVQGLGKQSSQSLIEVAFITLIRACNKTRGVRQYH